MCLPTNEQEKCRAPGDKTGLRCINVCVLAKCISLCFSRFWRRRGSFTSRVWNASLIFSPRLAPKNIHSGAFWMQFVRVATFKLGVRKLFWRISKTLWNYSQDMSGLFHSGARCVIDAQLEFVALVHPRPKTMWMSRMWRKFCFHSKLKQTNDTFFNQIFLCLFLLKNVAAIFTS